jgi:hypothetical protein
MGSKVFIANQVSSIVYSDAEKYGDLQAVTNGYVKFENVQDLSHQIMKKLISSSIHDFLVLSGNNLVCSMVFFLWMRKHGVCNILHWDKDKYVIVHMTDVSLPILL